MEDNYPVSVEVVYPESSSRILALIAIPFFIFKALLLIPHMIILNFLQIAAMVAVWFGYWAVLFTGRYPKVLFDFVVGVIRWQTRVSAWMFSLTDKYPPFGF